MRSPRWHLAVLLALAACKDPDTQAKEARLDGAGSFAAQGKAALQNGDPREAVRLLKQATQLQPDDAALHVLLARAHREQGNDAAAILELDLAEKLTPTADPALKKERALLLARMRDVAGAIAVMSALRDQNQLTDAEVLELARLQLARHQTEAAMKSLAKVQLTKPDDPEAKTVEAEVLLQTPGSELLAAKLMDRLLAEKPGLVRARELRARYFLQQGYPELTLQDLALLPPEPRHAPSAVELEAKALAALHREPEASELLLPLTQEGSQALPLIAMLAEIRLQQGQLPEAQELADRALALDPTSARALFTRGQVHAAQQEPGRAKELWRQALAAEPELVPALRALWPGALQAGEVGEALTLLQSLDRLGAANPTEKLELVSLAAQTGIGVDRAKVLLADALKANPKRPDLLKLKKRLASSPRPKGSGGSGGVQIIRGGR